MNDNMFLGTATEIALAAYAAMTGAVLGAFYDLLRAARMTVRHSRLACAAEDTVFALFFGLVFYGFCVELLEGKARLFVLVFMAAGFFLYLKSLGKILSGILSTVFKSLVILCKKPLCYLCGVTVLRRRSKKSEKDLADSEQNGV